MIVAGAAFLHLLVFVYWLGGDLGAFYASYLAVDTRRSPAARLLAIKVINDVDMAPHTALILALPTGLTLAALKGWLAVAPAVVGIVWLASLAWLALAWRLHLAHPAAGSRWRRVDLAIRWSLLAVLAAAGAAALAHLWTTPLFVALKLLLLAGAVGLGLAIRGLLGPLGPALAALGGGGDVSGAEDVVRSILARSRPVVAGIWLLICAAALLGLAHPQ